ncbi:DUF2934 domain-containing protein [Ancylobacter sp. MQZ15Z-1]|uniref:DUF2934 domain-containing protein n=1 Tax=Ancylobacter mangrovi TaxID=2972472 RepID=A0A9X2T5W9_9HYPH|nr:DUF2934 domain-containing protein [Ancylobacter mangrovi]MCS0495819.1 DUF2934 domain-containing protein [Ancylobacter mangrovi]
MDRNEQRVREAAYRVWEAEGRPEGAALDAWMSAHRLEKGEAGRAGDERPFPGAGPHARRDLINEDATPGSGALPSVDGDDPDVAPPTG